MKTGRTIQIMRFWLNTSSLCYRKISWLQILPNSVFFSCQLCFQLFVPTAASFLSAQLCVCLVFFTICTLLCCYCNRKTTKRKNWDGYYSFYNRRYTQQYINHRLKHFHMMKNHGYSKIDNCHHEIFDKIVWFRVENPKFCELQVKTCFALFSCWKTKN